MSDIDGVRKIEYVLMDAIGRRTGVCHKQWKDDEFVDIMPRMSDPIRAAGNEQRLLKVPTKSSRDEILTVLYCTVQQGRGRDDKVEGCVCTVAFITTMWSSVVVAQAAATD